MNNEDKKTKVIIHKTMCRFLLKAGCTIVDIKPDKDNQDKTVFVFSNTPELQEKMSEYSFDKYKTSLAKKFEEKGE